MAKSFSIDAVGTFLTPPRYGPSSTPRTAAAAEPIGACQAGTPDVVELDYRGVRTIHGLLSVGLLLEATCVDAHLSLDEALAPADRLWNDLMVRGAMLAIVGALLSIVASQWIASPVRKLAIAARAVQGGYFNRPIPIGGPSEIRALARRFARMARSVADLVTREQARSPRRRGRQPPEGRFPRHGVARAAHAVDGNTRVGAICSVRVAWMPPVRRAPWKRSNAAPRPRAS